MAPTIGRKIRSQAKSCKNRISDHIAFALIVYTLMLIFMVTPAIKAKGMAIWPYFLLVFLVILMVPFCRGIERRWARFEGSIESGSPEARRFVFDRCKLWIVAVGVPILISFGFSMI